MKNMKCKERLAGGNKKNQIKEGERLDSRKKNY